MLSKSRIEMTGYSEDSVVKGLYGSGDKIGLWSSYLTGLNLTLTKRDLTKNLLISMDLISFCTRIRNVSSNSFRRTNSYGTKTRKNFKWCLLCKKIPLCTTFTVTKPYIYIRPTKFGCRKTYFFYVIFYIW